jgi:hypothetical protein
MNPAFLPQTAIGDNQLFPPGIEETVARVVDDHVNATECGKRLIVKRARPELVAVLR